MSGAADAPFALRRLIFGQITSQVTATVARLGIADLLAGGPCPVADLAGELDADADGLGRLLRAAAGLGLVEEVAPGVFGLSALGGWLGSDPPSLRDLAIAMAAPGHSRSIEQLADAVITGRAVAPAALGTDIWDYFGQHPEEGAAFASAMGNVSEVIGEELVRRYDVSRFRRVVDVGGSRGVVLSHVLGANPEARGVLFDRAEIVAGARDELAARGVADRVDLVSGDFFVAVPTGGDLYLLKHIVHDWDDAAASRILATCRRASSAGSTLVLLERLVTPDSDPVTYLADLLMLVMFGGRERTREEYEALLSGAGWRLDRVVPVGMLWLLEASPV